MNPDLGNFVRYTFIALAMAFSASAKTPYAAEGSERPNFLFLLSDDQTFRALGMLGEIEVKTPNLDRLANSGMTFTHAFNQGGWSGAVCVPSRTMINTGRMLWSKTGPKQGDVAPDTALWGETLRNAGYATYMTGKWHIPNNALTRSFDSHGPLTGGFLESTPVGGPAYNRPAPGNEWKPDDTKWAGHWLKVKGTTIHSSAYIADSAIDYLQNTASKSEKPFFMYVGFNSPHDPRQAPREFLDMYPTADLKLPPNFLPEPPFKIGATRALRDEVLAPYPRTPEIIRVHLQEYYALVTYMDVQIGRILDALEASGKASNTVVIFTSDHGLAVGQHGLLGKQNVYDHSLRIPFLMAGPGIPKGGRCDALFYMQSLFATTCEMAEVPVPASVEFPSIVPLVSGGKNELYDALYGAYIRDQRSVRTSEWKLVRTPGANEVELFDIRKDPWEMHNLAKDPAQAGTLKQLDDRLRRFLTEMHDPMSEADVFTSPGPEPVGKE